MTEFPEFLHLTAKHATSAIGDPRGAPMASPHGTPAWSSPSTQRRPVTHVQPPSMRNLHRLVFELRNLLENSGNLESALDVVDDIENALNLPPAVPIPQTSNNEPPAKLELGPLVEEALGAVSPLLEQSGVIVLRRLGAGKVVLAQRTALLRLLEDVFRSAAVLCGRSAGLHVLRIRTKNGPCGLLELAIEYSGPSCAEPVSIKSAAQHVQLTHNAPDCIFRLTFLRRV